MSLKPRDAKLRTESLDAIYEADRHLMGLSPAPAWTAWRATAHNRQRTALRRIERAEAHLRRAKRALRVWARSKA